MATPLVLAQSDNGMMVGLGILWLGLVVIGILATHIPEWSELLIGLPAILLSYGAVIWMKGFTREDRVLFRLKKGEEPELPPPGETHQER